MEEYVRTYNTPLSTIIIGERIIAENVKANNRHDGVNETCL